MVAVDATNFQFYSGGVFPASQCSGQVTELIMTHSHDEGEPRDASRWLWDAKRTGLLYPSQLVWRIRL